MTKQLLTFFFAVLGVLFLGMSISSEINKEVELITRSIEIPTGKPGAPVSLTYTMPSKVFLNNAIGVTLIFNSSSSNGSLGVSINADDGLRLISQAAQSFALRGRPISTIASVLAERNGLYYLNINVSQNSGDKGSRQSRSFAVPIQVGQEKIAAKINGKLVDNGEEKIIEMIAD